jgi:hypothetical protein
MYNSYVRNYSINFLTAFERFNMKTLNIIGYNFSDPARVFYNDVSESDMLKKLGLVDGRTLENSVIGHLTDWANYKKILDSFKEEGFTHITNDDDSVDIHGNSAALLEDPIDNEIQRVSEGIEHVLSLGRIDSTQLDF